MLLSFLSTIVISLGMGGVLIGVRRVLRLPRYLSVDLGLTLLGAGLIFLMHLVSKDLFGLEEWYGLPFELAKHGLELVVILMMLVAF
ncbi:MAG: hypothetical protein O9292_07695 [Rhodobacteraceae bacterium]|jgi:hypothetical protein|nr:hypothetical protein [Paracoccaceae bacterium]MCZ8335078.1 hypothetical protein [Paracoccaceae bacterium]